MTFDFHEKTIGVAVTGSFCTYKNVFEELNCLAQTGASLYTIFSDNAYKTDSRFGKAETFLQKAKEITGREPITTIPDAEPSGPKHCLIFCSSHLAPETLYQNWPTVSLIHQFSWQPKPIYATTNR